MSTRRTFRSISGIAWASQAWPQTAAFDLAKFERGRILPAANQYLNEAPVTVTAASSPRSTGGRHDYFSEGDYWWPDRSSRDT